MAKKTWLEKAQEVVEELGPSYKVYQGYSGRFMFGKKCLGITGPSTATIIEAAARKGFRKAVTDNMGLDYIVYWPPIEG